jgi:tyrosinase
VARIRKDVWNLTRDEGDWPKDLVAYDRAVGLMRAADPPTGRPTNPLGWAYLAAIHGRAGVGGAADTSDPLWCTCQHGSWYFLPWHRMYLMAFELAVQDVLADPDWSLPYWYAVNPDDAGMAVLPPAFRDRTVGNDLFTMRRSRRMNAGAALPDLGASLLDALVAPQYSTPLGTSTFGGGERATPSFSGDETGLLEDTPHGAVHVLVGNDFDAAGNPVRLGWMGSFFTAALDPVFWLHHANLDRLWQVWLDADPAHTQPTGDAAWAATRWSFPRVGGGTVSWRVDEVLDPAALGYAYESTALPSALAPPPVVPPPVVRVGGPAPDPREARMPEPLPPQTLGAVVDVAISAPEPVEVELDRRRGPASARARADDLEPDDLDADELGQVFLRIEGITGTAAAPAYHVYVGVPPDDAPGDHPELRAGTFSTFGVIEASRRTALHDGTGLTKTFDITAVRDVLVEQGRWDPARLTVAFRPVVPEPVPGGPQPEVGRPADLRAGQVTVLAT